MDRRTLIECFKSLKNVYDEYEMMETRLHRELCAIKDKLYAPHVNQQERRVFMVENFFANVARKDFRRFYDAQNQMWFEREPEGHWRSLADLKEATKPSTSDLYEFRMENE